MTALLNCPFCGGEAACGHSYGSGYFACCVDIDCIGFDVASFADQPEAIASWNRRAPPPLPTREKMMRAACGPDCRCTEPRTDCGNRMPVWHTVDAVLRLLGGEKG